MVNALGTPESKLSPVPHAAAGPPVRAASVVTVCGVERIVHRTLSPAVIVVTAVAAIPPVLLVQSTNPTSIPTTAPHGEKLFPISTPNILAWTGIVVVVVVVVVVVMAVVVVV